ncbi:hypothetical protein F3J24_17960 [Comamonas sp. Tr-654]|uniref:hypothetical protein n=1 Tax=Comamonas sp. Tr-654 TaxID=2608341 RepID=UPI001421C857|nr:hypothetical protein [Comamonas sp. Tr-654]NIF85397.1 hypothetical protein [Comamonas sp. Tr-654]
MIKGLAAIALAVCSVILLLLWITSPVQAEEEPSEPPSPAGTVRMAARDAFVCPGMHAEWLDEKTVQCLKVTQ